jgi:MFS family permease
LWIRPLTAFITGFLCDLSAQKFRLGRFKFLILIFICAGISQLAIGLNLFVTFNMVFTNILVCVGFVFSLRSIYFSTFDELKIPNYLVGTSVGIVSVIGFLPDMFFGVLTGYIIDMYPSEQSYSFIFIGAAIVLFLGAIAAFINLILVKD